MSSLGLETSSASVAGRRNSFRKPPARSSSLDSNSGQQPGDTGGMTHKSDSKPQSKTTIIPELAALMVYTAGVKYQGFSKLVEYKTTEMFSVSEKVANKLLRSSPSDFIKHNRTHLSRVYPQGTRLSSSNYLPHQYWAMGCQLVSLNWQTYGMSFSPVPRGEIAIDRILYRFGFCDQPCHVCEKRPVWVAAETGGVPEKEQKCSGQ